MKLEMRLKKTFIVAMTAALAACGGSSDNRSPGSIVVEVPVSVDTPVETPVETPVTTPNGELIDSVIPANLDGVISDSGRVASEAFGGRPIYTIDVSKLSGGQIDPSGLLLGNDRVYEISGGALRVTGSPGNCTFEMAPGAALSGGSQFEFLVIEQGCQIDAQGTVEQPIVFTAATDIAGTVEGDARGLWGGVVLNGFAPINDCPEGAQGGTDACTKEGEANSGLFGGSDPEDNSGVLKYVSVRYAGSNVDPENQLNGIGFQGVGAGTEVDYVQIHNNLDDGVEFFGGTVNVRHMVLTGNADDSMDWTDGWRGSAQYVYVEQTDTSDNVIEADNREGDENVEPRSEPAVANMSAYGNPGERALRLRRGTGIALSNSLFDGSATCLRVDGESSRSLLGSLLTIAGTSFSCNEMNEADDDGAVAAYLDSANNVSQTGGAVDPVAVADSRLEQTDYIGAFGTEDWTAGWTLPGSVNFYSQPSLGCPTGTTDKGETIAGASICELEGTYTSDLVLSADNAYKLVGKVTIGDETHSATLKISSGTTIFGGSSFDFLVISQGSKIEARGTRSAPVVFTAQADLEGTANIDTDRGLWGGLVLNGYAPINDCPEGAEGGTAACTKEGEANSGLFGGDNPDDSSGILKYVVVKFAGSNVDPENQLNGIGFQGVGAGTEVDHVQIHNNLDDGVEFFGGTVSAKYLVLTGNADDGLDWTDGWRGSVQYVLIEQASDAGDNGIEADNREGDENALPRSMPRIANMTLTGNPAERAMRLRRGTGLKLFNSVVRNSANCLRVQGESLNLLGSDIEFDGVSLSCDQVNEGDDVAAVQSFLDGSNVTQDGTAAAAADLSGDAFFDATAFIGAVENEANDWTTGWTVGLSGDPVEFGCPAGTTELPAIAGTVACSLSGTISSDLQLTRGPYYVLDGRVSVGDQGSFATLSIQSGVTIVGDDPEDFLMVSQGSRIEALGTAMSPVVFTAIEDVLGTADQVNDRGLWGGLVLNGYAPINDCPQGAQGGTAACTKEGEANSGLFGGDNPDDSSGILKYVVVKFAGSNVDPQNQLNGIGFQGVGAGTEVDYVQVHNNLDDGFEFFGGTVSAKHIILTGNADDGLDWTDGWKGGIQYLHIEQASNAGDNGIEADNREGDELATPVSEPTLVNMTIVGNPGERAMRLRRGTGVHLFNSVVTGSASCVRVQGESENLYGTGITFESVSLDCPEVAEGDDVNALQTFLDGSVNVTQDGSVPPAASVPADGFFEQNDTVGSNVDAWMGGWAVGL